MAAPEKKRECPHCGIPLTLSNGSTQHPAKCAKRSPAERAYYRAHRAWPKKSLLAKILAEAP